MKLKNIQVKKIFLLSALFIFLGITTFSKTAKASCGYEFLTFSSDQTSVSTNDRIRFSYKAKKYGDTTCELYVTFNLLIKDKNLSYGYKNLGVKSIEYNTGEASTEIDFLTTDFDRSTLPDPTKLEFRGEALFATGVKKTIDLSIPISGATQTTGAISTIVSFKPTKNKYDFDEPIQIMFQVNSNDVAKLNNSIRQIYIVTSINGKNLDGFTKSRDEVANATQWKDTTTSKNNGFQKGNNNETITLWEEGTSIKLGQGSANLFIDSGNTDTEINNRKTPANPNNPNSPDTAPAKVDCEKNKDLPDCIYNPLPTDDLTSTFLLIIKGFLAIVGIWAVIFIIVGGFRMVVSAGNEEAVLQGKKTVTWAVIGLMVALLSFSAISIVQNLLHTAVK